MGAKPHGAIYDHEKSVKSYEMSHTHDVPHEHGEDVRVISTDEPLLVEVLEVLLGVRVQRIVNLAFQGRELELFDLHLIAIVSKRAVSAGTICANYLFWR